MKTLDEVTKALSICGRHPDCEGCPYENASYPTEIGNTCKDVMHYDALYYMQNRIDECQETNPILTWDELRLMEGKPIWIELLYHHPEQKYEYWDIIKRFDMIEDYELIVLSKSGYLYKDLLGKDWKAYKKEQFNTEYEDIPMEYFENGGI